MIRHYVSVGALCACMISLTGCGIGTSSNATSDTRGAAAFLVSTDHGKTFAPRVTVSEKKTIADVDILSMATDPAMDVMLIGTKSSGVFVSRDDGATWTPIAFPPQRVYGVAVHPTDTQIFYASGVYNNVAKIYKTTDGGATWDEVYTEPRQKTVITSLALDQKNPSVLYAGTSAGVVIKTTNGGEGWQQIADTEGAITAIAYDRDAAATVYFVVSGKTVLRTRDAGETIVDIKDAIAGQDNASDTSQSTTVRRSTAVTALAVDPTKSGTVYIGTEQGVYRSSDYGDHWDVLETISSADRIPVKVIAVNPQAPQEITYSVARTLYRATETQGQWAPVQISTSRVASVLLYDVTQNGTLYVGLQKEAQKSNFSVL